MMTSSKIYINFDFRKLFLNSLFRKSTINFYHFYINWWQGHSKRHVFLMQSSIMTASIYTHLTIISNDRLKRCGRKMWRSISFNFFFTLDRIHFIEQNLKVSEKLNYRKMLAYLLCTTLSFNPYSDWLICLFVWVFRPAREFFTHMKHHYQWRAANFDLRSALMTIKQWGFFCVPHLLWHGASVYNGHLRGPVTLTPIAGHLTVELSLPVFTT